MPLPENDFEQNNDNSAVGFPAGTRVTTDKGLKRIADIQIGDMVLSKNETDEQEFKPVSNITVIQNVEIFELNYLIVPNSTKEKSLSGKAILNASRSRKGGISSIWVAKNQLFWVKDSGWIPLESLKKGQLLLTKEVETFAYVVLVCPEYQTTEPTITASLGFTHAVKLDQFDDNKKPHYSFRTYSENGDMNLLLDGYSSHSPVEIENFGEVHVVNKARIDKTYVIEIADNNNFCMFNELWVRNANIAK